MTYYILLFLSIVFAISLSNRRNKGRAYYISFILSILFYTIAYGLRKDWAVDYVVYESVFEGTRSNISIEKYEFLFARLIMFLQFLNLDYHSLLIIVASLTIAVPILLLKDQKEISILAIPIFIMMCSYQASNLVRFFLAFSILNIGIYYLLQDKLRLCVVFAIASLLIHTGTILLMPFIFIFYRFSVMRNPKVVFGVFLVAFALGSISEYTDDSNAKFIKMSLDIVLSFLGDDSQLNKYSDISVINDWILGEREEVTYSIFLLSSRLLLALGFIFLGNRVLSLLNEKSKKKYFYFFYQMVCFALIIENITSGTEILTRFCLYFKYMAFIPVGIIMYHRHKFKSLDLILYACMCIGVLYCCFYEQKQLTEFNLLYVWD